MMINKDISDLLEVAEIELCSIPFCADFHDLDSILKQKLDIFMRFANYRNYWEWRYIPVGFNFSVAEVVNSTGQGFFRTRKDCSITIPYCKVANGGAKTEREKEVYREYDFSIFRYEIFYGKSMAEVNRNLENGFLNLNKERKDYELAPIRRPIGLGVQQVSSYIPQPALQGFMSNYMYIGIIIYEEIHANKCTFLNRTGQIYSIGRAPDITTFWKDGREIGSRLYEDIKKFPEEEGVIFDKPMAIMYPDGGSIAKLIPERPTWSGL